MDVVPITEADIELLAGAFARAFHDEPLSLYLLSDEERRREVLPVHYKNVLRYGFLYREVYTDDDRRGAAMWWRPDDSEPTIGRLRKSGLARTPELLGAEAFQRLMQFVQHLILLKDRCLDDPHWYLANLAVDPAYQGHGIGGAIIQPILERADASGLPCYLETEQRRNVPFYQRHGFRVLIDEVDSVSGLRVWTMRRDPQRPK